MKRIVLSALMIFGVFGFALGQDADKQAADRALRGSGRVNASTLGMEFNLPLGSFPGRGINMPINLSYSSKIWRSKYLFSTPVPGGNYGGCHAVNSVIFSEDSASGWTTSLATPYIEYSGTKSIFRADGLPVSFIDVDCPSTTGTPDYRPYEWVRRLVVHLPSGETHEMRADDTIRTYAYYSNCVDNNPSTPCDPNDPSIPENWNTTYYAVDGSNLKYVQNSVTSTYRLLMPDGSFYDFDSASHPNNRKATQYTDRNGNYTTYHAPDASYPQGRWTDTLGKTISIPIGVSAPSAPTTAASPQVYSMPGMTGNYKLHWKRLKEDGDTTGSESALTNFSQNLRFHGNKYVCGTPPTFCNKPEGTYLFSTEGIIWAQELFNPVVLTKIELPTGESYRFSYDLYGRIERIYYPTGGEERFEYGVIPLLSLTDPGSADEITNFGVKKRWVYETAADATPYLWTYNAGHLASGGYRVQIISPDGTKTERLLHRANDPDGVHGSFGYDNALAGMPYEERSFDSSGQIVSRKLTHWEKKIFSLPFIIGPGAYSFQLADWHPRVLQEENIVYNDDGDGVSTAVRYEYEGDLNLRESPVLVKKTTQYAFEVRTDGNSFTPSVPPCDPEDENCTPPPSPTPTPSPTPVPTPTSSPVKIVESTYLISDPAYSTVKANYTNQNMVGLVTASQVKDGAGTVVSRSEMAYDETGYPIVSAGTAINWQNPSNSYRGNPTTAKVWDSTKGVVTNSSAYVSTHAQFDNFGNQIKAWDAKGNFTTTAFDTTYYAFPVSVTSPIPDPSGQNASNTAFVTTATFDSVTGLPLTTTDANGLETRIEYDSVTLRPKNTKTYFGGNQVGSTAETIYHDEPNNYWVKNRSQIDADKWAESIRVL